MNNPTFRIEITRRSLIEGLGLLKKTVARRKHEEAILSHDGECLHIEVGGGGIAVAASGDWEGQIKIRGPLLLDLVAQMPQGDPLLLRVEDGFLLIGNLRLRCSVQKSWSKTIDLPVNVARKDIVTMLASNSREDLIASGLDALVPPGQLDSESFLARLDAAAKLLAPEGVRREELLQWIRSRKSVVQGELFD